MKVKNKDCQLAEEKYKKISWVYQMPELFEIDLITQKLIFFDHRLDSISKKNQKFLIYKIIQTFKEYFGYFPGNNDENENLESIVEIWVNGLCDLSIRKIIEGLLEILNLKTEYQKWPPKSVMAFYAICNKSIPPYHSEYKFPKKNINLNSEVSNKIIEEIKEKLKKMTEKSKEKYEWKGSFSEKDWEESLKFKIIEHSNGKKR